MWASSFASPTQSLVLTLLLCIIIAAVEANQGERSARLLKNPLFHPNSTFTEGTSEREILTVMGNRTYGIHIPVGISGNPPPVILDFHGFNNIWQNQSSLSGLKEVADERKDFIVVWPEGSRGRTEQTAFNVGGWINEYLYPNDIDDANFTVAIIEEIKNNIRIDPRRIYAHGYSQGAGMTMFISYTLNNYIAAIVANALPLNKVFFDGALEAKRNTQNFHPIPVQNIHGYLDNQICWEKWCLTNFLDPLHDFGNSNAKMHWRNWAIVNDCKGDPVTLAKNPAHGNHTEYLWIKAYQSCAEGVEVIQILNDHDHTNELVFFSGGIFKTTNGAVGQRIYAERNVDFLLRWTLPDYVPVTVPEWWMDL